MPDTRPTLPLRHDIGRTFTDFALIGPATPDLHLRQGSRHRHTAPAIATPDVILQRLGGSTRQLGVLFAPGLLILFTAAGSSVLAGVAFRLMQTWLRGPAGKVFYNGVAARFRRQAE